MYTLGMTDRPATPSAGAGAPGAAGEAGPRLLALLDYDGTMTTHECNEVALQPLVGDPWWELEEESYNDRMSHAEVFDRQIGLIEVPRAEVVQRLLDAAEPMPGLHDFVTALLDRGGEAAIVSAGIREAIEAFWRRLDLPPVELFASELIGGGPDGGPPYRLEFSDALGDCPRCGPDSCKAAILRRLRRPGDVVLVFGDGPSDLCPAREADLVFARAHLAERCEQEGLEWRPLTDFGRVLPDVDAWLALR
jgi:2-hydroxy-3-keto-5-methylthiopentenyl-1-phosphate phosphatase